VNQSSQHKLLPTNLKMTAKNPNTVKLTTNTLLMSHQLSSAPVPSHKIAMKPRLLHQSTLKTAKLCMLLSKDTVKRTSPKNSKDFNKANTNKMSPMTAKNNNHMFQDGHHSSKDQAVHSSSEDTKYCILLNVPLPLMMKISFKADICDLCSLMCECVC